MNAEQKKAEALEILTILGFPRAQQNDRSALCLLALLNLYPGTAWNEAANPLIGITPIMDWTYNNYAVKYAPNSRETFRRQTMHQFIEAGIARYNPDDPTRSVNSPKAVYQIEPATLELLRSYGTADWDARLVEFLGSHTALTEKYARERELERIPLTVSDGSQITFSPGAHSELIRAIVEEFGPRFVPGGLLMYAGAIRVQSVTLIETHLRG